MIGKKMIIVSVPCINPRLNVTMTGSGKVKNLFFIDKGSTTITATYEKDSYNVGEIARVECVVDNTHCDKSIRCIKLKFTNIIKDKTTLFKKKGRNLIAYGGTLFKTEYPGVRKG
jgi:hypothetical protein